MKISNSMGVTGGQQSTLAAVLGGLNYEYTWAYDASKQDDVTVISGYSTYNASLVDDGININFTGSFTTFMSWADADFPAESVSAGPGIPDGVLSQSQSGAIGHPGRYFSIVATLNQLTVAGGTISHEIFGHIIQLGDATRTVRNFQGIGSDPSHINGDSRPLGTPDAQGDRSLVMPQSEIDPLIGKPIAVTYDLNIARYTSVDNTDPTAIQIAPARNTDVTMDATIHGFIFSNVPPIINNLPVEIDNPTL